MTPTTHSPYTRVAMSRHKPNGFDAEDFFSPAPPVSPPPEEVAPLTVSPAPLVVSLTVLVKPEVVSPTVLPRPPTIPAISQCRILMRMSALGRAEEETYLRYRLCPSRRQLSCPRCLLRPQGSLVSHISFSLTEDGREEGEALTACLVCHRVLWWVKRRGV